MATDVQERSSRGSVRTTGAPPAHRERALWRDALARTLGAAPLTVPGEPACGTVRTSALGRLRTATVEGGGLSALRSGRTAGTDGRAATVVVTLLDSGTARLDQDGREAVLEPGDVVVHDLARPFRLAFPGDFRAKCLLLPRDVLGLSASETAQVTARRFGSETPLGCLLSPLLAGLVDGAGDYAPHTLKLMARNAVDLLGLLADEVLARSGAETPGGDRALLLRIQEYIDRNLADPELTPEVIAQAHHISLRYLHKLFEGEDATVRRWIQRRRLKECRHDLALHRHTTISAVAHRWGFTSAAHFSRAFRAAYGMSPREWRAVQESAPGPAHGPAAAGAPSERTPAGPAVGYRLRRTPACVSSPRS
ncbi:helix-turn-helix domain-containing protein [Kitasatospora sp. NPDC059462]|uniref:helix-turn-helix domain-containing protein n=1 Tax=Kitasatospora sp. NPDC059462 TaxID=3346841 RepID=UPI00368CC346